MLTLGTSSSAYLRQPPKHRPLCSVQTAAKHNRCSVVASFEAASSSGRPVVQQLNVTSCSRRSSLLHFLASGASLLAWGQSSPAIAEERPVDPAHASSTPSDSPPGPIAAPSSSNSSIKPPSPPSSSSTEQPAAAPQTLPPPASVPKDSIKLSDEAAKKMLVEEEEHRKQRRRKKGRIQELEEIRGELAEKELILLSKEQELLEKDQTLLVMKEELDLERKLRALLTKEKEKAEEQAALAMGLCTGGAMLP